MPDTDLKDRIRHLVGFDVDRMIERVRDLSLEADRARALSEHLEHTRKVILSEQVLDARRRAEGKVPAAQILEAEARTSLAYRNHLDAMKQAGEKRAAAYAQYSAARSALDWAQRQVSFLQTEMKAGGNG